VLIWVAVCQLLQAWPLLLMLLLPPLLLLCLLASTH
jgi:hypothetical protein